MNENNDNVSNVNPVIVERGMTADGSYKFLAYDAKAPIVEANKRTAKLMYKKPKDGSKQKDNVCLLLPHISKESVETFLPALMPHIITMCETTQDVIAKELHTSNDAVVAQSAIDMESIVRKLEQQATSQRLNKEVLASWFDATLADSLSILFSDKLGLSDTPTSEDTDKVNRFVTVYKNKFTGLASNVTHYPEAEVEKLLTAIDKAEVNTSDSITSRVLDRLDNMLKPVDLDEMLGL